MEVKVTGKLEIEQKGQAGKQENTAMQAELLKQLHEQYAVNNNANLGTIVTLVVAVIAVIGYFGYVYVHTGVDFSKDFGCLIAEEVNDVKVYYLDALLLIYLASVLVIAILIRLCIYQGVAQRKEQFIIDGIRSKCFGPEYLWSKMKVDNSDKEVKIFPQSYHPYHKKGLDIVQGLYGELIKIFIGITCLLTLGVLLKLYANITILQNIDIDWLGVIESLVCFFAIGALWRWCKVCYNNSIASYESRQDEYSERKKEIEAHVKNKGKGEDKKRWICFLCKLLKQQSEACKTKNKPN